MEISLSGKQGAENYGLSKCKGEGIFKFVRGTFDEDIVFDDSFKGLLSTQAMRMLLERRPAMGSRHCWPCSSLVLCSVFKTICF